MAKAELVLIGTDDGVVLLSNPGAIGRWLKSAHALRGHAIVATWANPDDPTQMLCSSVSHLWQSIDGGQTWQIIDGPPCTIMIASRVHPNRIWAHDGQAAYLSHDSGGTWHRVASAAHIAGGGDVIWYRHHAQGYQSRTNATTWDATPAWEHVVWSHDGQQHWFSHAGVLQHEHSVVAAVPADFVPLLACVGTPHIVGMAHDGIWLYTESTWQHITTLNQNHITCMTTTLYHPDRAWAGDSAGNVWYSSDRCLTWELVRGGFGAIRAVATARLH